MQRGGQQKRMPSAGPHKWRDDAACRAKDPELFFPITALAKGQIEEAKAVCMDCRVASTCFSWALETGQHHGIWGGFTEEERHALKRRDQRARRAS